MGFGLPCATHRLQDLWGLSTDFLERQGSRNTPSDHRGSDSENQAGDCTHPGPLTTYSDIGELCKGLGVAEPKHCVLPEEAEAAVGFVDPRVTAGVVGNA